MSFTISDPTQPDDPLVWVNPAFTDTTGYAFDEAVGRNCRFLQGAQTDRRVVAELGAGLSAARPMTTTLLNYRKDGSTFWNEVSISPVRDSSGALIHFVGVQADVTARVEAQRARDDALSQVAVAADRLALLADFTSRMAWGQDPHQVIEMLAEVITPRIGTWCAVFTYDDVGHLVRPHVRHEREPLEPELRDLLARLRDVAADQLPDSGPIRRVLNGVDRDVLIRDFDAVADEAKGWRADERTALIREIGARSMIVAPLLARSGVRGCLAVATDDTRAPLGDAELALTRDLTVRAGLMLENTQLYARERAAAASLQRSLLPRLPRIPGLQVAAEYVPAADEAAVGGDWYDVFALRSDGVGVAVGDVMGHNYDSAALMGKLSTVLRSYAWPGSEPRDVLAAVDELIDGSGPDVLATCLYAKLSLHHDGATVRYSSAGHPPAIVRWPDGSTTLLGDGRGPMIGVGRLTRAAGSHRIDAVVELPSGSTLICFTDGLIDAFAAEPDLDLGLAELSRLTAALPVDASPRVVVAKLTETTEQYTDDVAVVAIRIG
jgi:PAS domain S-box-containing protein